MKWIVTDVPASLSFTVLTYPALCEAHNGGEESQRFQMWRARVWGLFDCSVLSAKLVEHDECVRRRFGSWRV